MRARPCLAAFVTLVACRGGERAAPRDAAPDACARAVAGLQADRIDGGLGPLLAACRPCGVAWEPLVALSSVDPDEPSPTLPTPDATLAVLDACGVRCSGGARRELGELLRDAASGRAASAPWRRLVERCPGALRVDEHTVRFARGTWFALDQVARALWRPDATPALVAARDAARLEFPLPPLSMTSTAIAVPTAERVAAWAPRLHVTITADRVQIGALPRVTLAGGALRLVDGPGLDYPGTEVPLDELARALTDAAAALPADAERRVVLIAPRAMPATRLAAVVARLPGPAHLAVTPARHDAPWPEPIGASPAGLTADPRAPALDLPAGATVADVAARLADRGEILMRLP